MKRLTIICLLLSMGISAFAKPLPPDTSKTKIYYLGKSKNLRKTGWLVFGAGAATTVAGFIGMAAEYKNNISFDLFGNSGSSGSSGTSGAYHTYTVIAAGGLVVMAASIPLFVASHHNKKEAMRLAAGLEFEQTWALLAEIGQKDFPAIAIKIPLNSR